MKKTVKRGISLMIALLMCASLCTTVWADLDYPNTWVNTGDQAKDIAQIALTQVGYAEIETNHTKYNQWYYGSDVGTPWCAIFVSWCANQAGGVPGMKKSSIAGPDEFGLSASKFSETAPQIGDIAFIEDNGNANGGDYGYDHVGIVCDVDEDYLYVVEGNRDNIVDNRTYSLATGIDVDNSTYYIVWLGKPEYKKNSSLILTSGNVLPRQAAKTPAEVTAIVEEYISVVGDNRYWNANIRTNGTEILKQQVDAGDYLSCTTTKGCAYSGDHTNANGCTSNKFTGVSNGLAQCWGFADYIEYVIFKTTNGKSWSKLYSVGSDFIFTPGDCIRYYDGSETHSVVVYKVSGNDVYLIAGNDRWTNYRNNLNKNWGKCHINHYVVSASTLRNKINDVSKGSADSFIMVSPVKGAGTVASDAEPKLSISNLTVPPTSHPLGKNFGLKGTITTDYGVITNVLGYIYNETTQQFDQRTTEEPNRSTYDIRTGNVNTELKFGTLPAGTYIYGVEATANNNGKTVSKNLIYSRFSVTDNTVAVKVPQISITDPAYPTILALNDNFGLRGTIKTDCGVLTEVTGEICYENGVTVDNRICNPYEATLDIQNSVINNSLSFAALNAGKYKYIVTATADNNGVISTVQLLCESFTVGDPTAIPPTEPANFVATYVDDSTIALSWTASPNADSYNVQYYNRTNATWKRDHDYTDGISYQSTGVGEHKDWDYRVRAVKGGAASDWVYFHYYAHTEHTWNLDESMIVKEPTCTVTGTMLYECTLCSATKTETISATGHSFSTQWSSNDLYHWYAATCEHTEETSAKAEHLWDDGIITTEATKLTDGVMTYKCTVCGREKEEIIPAQKEVLPNFEVEHPTSANIIAPEGGWVIGENTFSVSAERPCVLAVSYDGGQTYTRLTASANGDGSYSFDVNITDDNTILVCSFFGDSNGDGDLSSGDVSRLNAGILHKVTLSALSKLVCDVNNDSDLSSGDVSRLNAVILNKVKLSW